MKTFIFESSYHGIDNFILRAIDVESAKKRIKAKVPHFESGLYTNIHTIEDDSEEIITIEND